MDLPHRHRNHEIQELSERYLRNNIPPSWVVNMFTVDYGTDYNCEISKDHRVLGHNFTIQLKGKETEVSPTEILLKGIKRSTANRWMNRLEPTMLIVYVVDENEAYWCWFEKNMIDLSQNSQTFQVKIPRDKRYSEIDWDEIADHIAKIFSRKHHLYDITHIDEYQDAWQLYLDGKYERALPLLKELVSNDTKGDLWNALAMSHYQLFHYKDALIAINKGLALTQNSTMLFNKASILTEYGVEQHNEQYLLEALSIYETLKTKDLSQAPLYYNLANAYKGLKEYETAIEFYTISLSIDPNQAEGWKNLGSCYFELNDHITEIICYNKALTINPQLPQALFSKGVTLLSKFGQVHESIKLMEKAVDLSTTFDLEFAYAYFWVAEAYLKLGDIKTSMSWNAKGLANNPADTYFLKQRDRLAGAINN